MKKFTFAALAVPLMWVLLLLLFFSSNKLHAQETTVLSGMVKSADGTPMDGVTVWQKDTDNGTQTNEQGFYTLNISPNAVVVYEYIGYKTQSIPVSGKILNVTLVADDDTLEELVINAGYYSVKDKERTGSISKITSKEIGQQPVANPLAAMQGRMAGVNITQSSGTPGGGFDIQIRGRNSLRTEGNAPLYIVDGVPLPAQPMSDSNIAGGILPVSIGSNLNSIDPNNIESIEILKDADATAIYGSRGSNGVVLITTKKGSSDKKSFSVQSTTSVSSVSRYMDLMDTQQYLQMRRDAYANDGITEYPANAYDVNGKWNQDKYTDWQQEFIGRKAVSQNTQVSVSGGKDGTNYMLSMAHRKDETVSVGGFGYKRINFLLNVNHQSENNRFKMQTSVQKSNQNNKQPAADLSGQVFLAPNSPDLYDLNGNLNWENNTFENPLGALQNKYNSETNDLIIQTNINYRLVHKLDMGISIGISDKHLQESRIAPSTAFNPALGVGSDVSSLLQSSGSTKGWIIEPNLKWKTFKGVHRWEALVGATFEERTATSFGIQALDFSSDDLIYNAANAAYQFVLRDSESKYKYMAFFGRFNYINNDKYIVNLTGRRDGSSRFGPNNRFANFGAIGAAWLFGKEKLFDNNSWFSFGKLRASYGITGSDLIGDYQYLNTFGIDNQKYDGTIGLKPLRLYNPDFSWETNKKLEAALELEFFNGRMAAGIAWYRNRSSNQLVGVPLPGTTGFSSIHANLNATVENRGWEFTLHTTNIDGDDFVWKSNINITLPKNKLIAFPNLEHSTYANQYVIGESVNVRKLFNYVGVDPVTGLHMVEDVNNDGLYDIKDRTNIQTIGPTFHGGFYNSFRYKNFSFDMLWAGALQNGFTEDYYRPILGSRSNLYSSQSDYWSPDNPNAKYQKPSTGANAEANQAHQRYISSSAVITTTSYVRLKNIQLNYQFSISKVNANIFIQGQNLLTITGYRGIDPESISSFTPVLKTWSAGGSILF